MYESNLVPVVGFHSNGESVRVNFGLVPFAYEVCMAGEEGTLMGSLYFTPKAFRHGTNQFIHGTNQFIFGLF